ncbi:unnamed protein product [Candidatus Paraburkholderia kirkii UZHbot1]|uniref:WGS project CAFE00000000 data, contig bkir_c47 n=1 Tax=Candidatus Paraburkholderia kirkii UZHbot1 TaxID=1055526 RepID=U3UAX7_9BURK|nr:unnamed protein product [Candidatus Paraburkholderia kirkii UZHbot1]
MFGSYSKRLPPLSVSDIARSKLTYLPAAKLQNITQCIQKVQTQRVPGDFVEFGVALGGSGIFIARQMARSRRFVGLDVCGMIPAPGPRDDQKSHEVIGSSPAVNPKESAATDITATNRTC